ncbi:hypothetical protein GRI89_02605 [Altererythrobacter salegens]|uniref:OmpA-like domain-containing protein n=1 Tax=Croceibacterium salegens TaxID=1737568 RepID=A0A6I4SSX8_9SPHN|nr:hypothetical protein [Croceibacterium salegens]MXO58438.1 hypothetical protein [Croceibacterium salegens]
MRLLPVSAAVLASASFAAQAAEPGPLPFVACPIVQDTPTVPCWIVERDGETYYLGIQSDVSAPFNPPSLGHKVLVEGGVDRSAPRICGGLVIDPVTVSIMPEASPECDDLRMVNPHISLPFEPPRPPGPSMGRLAFTYPDPPAAPQPPFETKSFTVPYEFEGMVGFKTPRFLNPVLLYAQQTNARRVEIRGYRGATKLADGTLLAEHEGIARARAEEIAAMLLGAGIDQATYVVSADESPALGGPDNRRVEIRIVP